MTDNRTTELLPCPFCGDEAKLTKINHATWVECSNYHYERHQVSVHAKTEAEAIAAWNTRAELVSGTCKVSKPNCSDFFNLCSECGEQWSQVSAPKFCPNCEKAVER